MHLSTPRLILILGTALIGITVALLSTVQWNAVPSSPVDNATQLGQMPVRIIRINEGEISPLQAAASKPLPMHVEPYTYVEVIAGCDAGYVGACANIRAEPSADASIVKRARVGSVFRTDYSTEKDGLLWYHIVNDPWLRYPDRVTSSWFISSTKTEPVNANMDASGTSTKSIIIDISSQMLYAYEGKKLVMSTNVSTGIKGTPTPLGTFRIFKKTPSRYMQGPIVGISDHYYDLPGVPWNMYFTEGGAAIHGAYWHNDFGEKHSNGCVNLPLAMAEKMYKWAELGTPVLVRP